MKPFAVSLLLLAALSSATFLLGSSNVEDLRKRAETGDTKAQYSLGEIFLTGDGVSKDSTEALKWYRKAAEQGELGAQDRLGLMYASGDGVAKDQTEAAKWYRRAAEQGHPEAQYSVGTAYLIGEGVPRDDVEGTKWLRRAAEQGNGRAQNILGAAYANGRGVAKDPAEAVKWYRKAAEQGGAIAQFNLGLMYARGEGVIKDPAEAVKWYRKAAEQSYADAQCSLGVMYLEGVGVLSDEVEALAWFNVSAASGSSVAVRNRASLERQLGRQATLAARQRAKEILDEIKAGKGLQTASRSSSSGEKALTTTLRSSGSGAIVSARGHVLTAAHVVSDAGTLSVVTARGTWPATVLRIDEANDVAILKISGGTYVPLPVAPSRRVRLGQTVATIGFPNIGFQGFSPKVTRGEISSVNGFADDPRSWQISVPVQPGNSGGPLLDENGNLIGIVVSKFGLKAVQATGDIPQNVNYAVKSAYALALLEPYLDENAPEPRYGTKSFEDMVAQAQSSVVLILAY